MSEFIKSILFILLLLGIEFFNDIVIKKWTQGLSNTWTLVITLVIHVAAFFLWILALKNGTFSKVIFIYSTLSIIGGLLLGIIIFHDKLNVLGWIGMAMGIVGVLLMSIP